jgi:hypothetical protein
VLPQGLDLQKTQNTWASQLNPVIANQLVNGLLIKNVGLINGVTVVNHLLARQMQGWFIVDINAAVTTYRSQPMNDKTLTLTSSGVATCNLWVF